MYDVVCFGSAVLDVAVRSSQFKVLKNQQMSGGVAMCEVYGGKMDVDEISLCSGGGATNVGVGLTRLGHRVGSVFKVTRDKTGQLIMDQVKQEGLDTSLAIQELQGKSAMSVILIAPDGGRSILTYRGASKQLASSEIDWDKLNTKWFYISSLGGQMELLEDLFAFASTNKISVAFNPGRGELTEKTRLLKLIKKSTILFLNRLELASLVNKPYEDEKGLVESASTLGAMVTVVTEGTGGARALINGRQFQAKAFKIKSTDDTGAGDAFGAGFLSGILREVSLDQCLKMGVANGASAVQEIGAKSGLLNEREMHKWLEKSLVITEETIKHEA